jgi:hypothetical protein
MGHGYGERVMGVFTGLGYRGAAQCSGLQAGGEGPRGSGRQAASVL